MDLARFAVNERAENAVVLRKWIDRWTEHADEAAFGLGGLRSRELLVRLGQRPRSSMRRDRRAPACTAGSDCPRTRQQTRLTPDG